MGRGNAAGGLVVLITFMGAGFYSGYLSKIMPFIHEDFFMSIVVALAFILAFLMFMPDWMRYSFRSLIRNLKRIRR